MTKPDGAETTDFTMDGFDRDAPGRANREGRDRDNREGCLRMAYLLAAIRDAGKWVEQETVADANLSRRASGHLA